jgi:hypothetical protein
LPWRLIPTNHFQDPSGIGVDRHSHPATAAIFATDPVFVFSALHRVHVYHAALAGNFDRLAASDPVGSPGPKSRIDSHAPRADLDALSGSRLESAGQACKNDERYSETKMTHRIPHLSIGA